MSKIGIFFGSTTGNTETIANSIAEALGVDSDNVKEIAGVELDELEEYDVLLLGSSTWGSGDLQDDWEGIIEDLEDASLAGKKVAVFGSGDSSSYPDTFCNAMATVAAAAQKAGATLIADKVDASGYEFDESESVVDGNFIGLAIDEDNESDKTDERIAAWVEQIKAAL